MSVPSGESARSMEQVALMEPSELVGSAIKTRCDGGLIAPVCKKTLYGPLKPGKLGDTVNLSWRPVGKSTNSAPSQPGTLFLRVSGSSSALNTWGRAARYLMRY